MCSRLNTLLVQCNHPHCGCYVHTQVSNFSKRGIFNLPEIRGISCFEIPYNRDQMIYFLHQLKQREKEQIHGNWNQQRLDTASITRLEKSVKIWKQTMIKFMTNVNLVMYMKNLHIIHSCLSFYKVQNMQSIWKNNVSMKNIHWWVVFLNFYFCIWPHR